MSNVSVDSCNLLEGIANGSVDAFELFYDRYYAFVYSVAYNLLKDKLEAEDICHDIFIEISNKAHTYEPSKGSVEAWLAIRTRSRCVDLIRKKREVLSDEVEKKKENTSIESYIPVEEKVIRNLDKELIVNALNKLPFPQKNAIYGSYFQQFTQKELAGYLKMPLGTVKSLVRYGIKNLRKELLSQKDFNSLKGDEKS
ncbi:RNA polymerase sigma factor [Lederbergia wuyishanensis]|uniref:RNA polymerase sigma-70 factor (ECF subfamily) n=1 Tax=Lederbergia wuyishanensis TaxID=1347903 RepID=A0ABU0D844_9BACI|nr:sigma-70 family RNA polymerase sigma factor [Lederbergia wuyishanensis]MCJ8009272.1 sigma-70 family RNA polymerase sigma factor [Lederbergia wuyishanensis]MDQ0344594.1 RNA polymerase sigma-70 factor (ECF subfamily) [Lederbergia wuyishanensis]